MNNNDVCMDMYTNQYNFDRMFQYVCKFPKKRTLRNIAIFLKGRFLGTHVIEVKLLIGD